LHLVIFVITIGSGQLQGLMVGVCEDYQLS